MRITVLCKVVDNFGDVGVMLRMVKHLLAVNSEISEINIVIDNLDSFNKLDNQIDAKKDFQQIGKMSVYNWNNYDLCYKAFSEDDGEKLSVILELFQCGRPDWMEKILFEDKISRTCHIIMIDYLTAEKYAEDFHCLDSLTRSKNVKKVNFMPGFTNKTGGLIIDEAWKNLPVYDPEGPVLVFTYEKNWTPLVKSLKNWNRKILLAQGRGHDSFYNACSCMEIENQKLENLPYLTQDKWDQTMKTCSVLFIRGEESMSRACLSGIPFVWHAYPQSDEYQMVKVNALLDRLSSHFNKEDFEIIKDIWLDFNKPEQELDEEKFGEHCEVFLKKSQNLAYGFSDFAEDLRKNGDLCDNLMTFIEKNIILQ